MYSVCADCVLIVRVQPNIEGLFEQHITGDIAMALRQYFLSTRDLTWLNESAWEAIEGACNFFACRATAMPLSETSIPSVPQASSGGNCGEKLANASAYTLLNVQPPDESAGVVNSSVYTNAIAAATLAFGIEAGAVLGREVRME